MFLAKVRFVAVSMMDGSNLFECTGVDHSSCSIGGRAFGEIVTNQEIQQVILGSSSWRLGETSDVISLGDSLSSMEEKLWNRQSCFDLLGLWQVCPRTRPGGLRSSSRFIIPRGFTGNHGKCNGVRVFAYNGIGEGPPTISWPSPLRLSTVAWQAPQDVVLVSLKDSWNRLSGIGGVQLTGFIFEYDTTS